MKKLESTLPNMVIVLTAVTIIAAGLLGVMQQLTKEPIEQITKKTLEDGIKKVMLSGADGELTVTKEETLGAKGEFTVYTAESNGKLLGKAVKTAVNAFSPNFTVLTGFDTEGNILGYEILNTAETPGLGAKAGTWFQKESGEKRTVIGKNPGKNDLRVSKDGGEIDAITASTITSRAFLNAIKIEYDAIFNGQTDGSSAATAKAAPAATDSTAVAVPDSVAAEVVTDSVPEAAN